MRYENEIREAVFLRRPNRFIAEVRFPDETEQRVHVRNTGRCRELLIPGTTIWLEKGNGGTRKTNFSLIAVQKGERLINMDSQVVNPVVEEALREGRIPDPGKPSLLLREKTWAGSRFDFYYETPDARGFIEVKGVTLEREGLAMFPDAPTLRGEKHLRHLMDAQREGFCNYVIFVVQMEQVEGFTPNEETDPAFAESLREAYQAGVKILAYSCEITEPGEIRLAEKVSLDLGNGMGGST